MRLIVPTETLTRPSLSVDSLQVIDDGTDGSFGNGNGIIESGETVNLDVFVRNSGPGTAYGATLTVTHLPEGVLAVRPTASAGVIAPGKRGKARLTFSVPRSWSGGDAFPISLKVIDGRGEEVAMATKELALRSQSRTPLLSECSRSLPTR